MKAVFETKTVNRKLINLEEVSIDVQATQKVVPCNPEYALHIKNPADGKAALQYDRILNETIEDLLVAISDNTEPNLNALAGIFSIDKRKISYIAILNLQIIQKLQYILEKFNHLKTKFDTELLKLQIKYWRELLVSALTDTTDQETKYGKAHDKQAEAAKKMSEQAPKHEPASDEPVKQKIGVRKTEAIENSRSRAMRSKAKNKNGTNQVYDCVDS